MQGGFPDCKTPTGKADLTFPKAAERQRKEPSRPDGIHTATGGSSPWLGVAQQVSGLTQGVPVSKEHFMKLRLKASTFACLCHEEPTDTPSPVPGAGPPHWGRFH